MTLPYQAQEINNVCVEDLLLERAPIFVLSDDEDEEYSQLMNAMEKQASPSKIRLFETIHTGHEDITPQQIRSLSSAQIVAAKREAILAGRHDMLKLLLEQDRSIDESVITTACDRRDRDSISLLMAYGWDINAPLSSNTPLLCFAVDDTGFTQWLIAHGADVNARSVLDESALTVAIAHGAMDVVHLLLAEGTEVEHGDLLHSAALRRDQFEGAQLVKELVRRGADVNAYRYNNPVALRWRGMAALLTPLHIACCKGNLPVVQALLECNADPHQKLLDTGRPTPPTPLDEALSRQDQALINLLRSDWISTYRTSTSKTSTKI